MSDLKQSVEKILDLISMIEGCEEKASESYRKIISGIVELQILQQRLRQIRLWSADEKLQTLVKQCNTEIDDVLRVSDEVTESASMPSILIRDFREGLLVELVENFPDRAIRYLCPHKIREREAAAKEKERDKNET